MAEPGLPEAPPRMYDATGAIHCHSTYSDGSGTVEEIVSAAQRAGLEYLVMTDHDTLAPLREKGEGWHGRTLVLYGVEISPRHNHYLAYGIEEVPSFHLPPAEFIRAVRELGGVGFLAHPWDYGSPVLGLGEYSWQDWEVDGFTGIEIWNYFSGWVGSITSVWDLVRGLLNWRAVSMDPDPRTLARWDQLALRRPVVGIGGVDAHGIRRRILGVPVTFHPYERAFRTVRTHLLLPRPWAGDVAEDRRQVLGALRHGRAYVANWEQGDPRGFRFLAWAGGRWLGMGDRFPHPGPAGSVHFSVETPRDVPGVRIALFWNGRPMVETDGPVLQGRDAGPGVYRVEVYRRGRGWIYSNPICLEAPMP
ncbi:PHP domain-containing protein [Caldinitratiruptor microaerophilus]|uniref:Phosphotransferase n=1 Tax=Caldinitratiruptor microaerophilus TaxID=671077 RepID=A0AA35CL13_9FIRM|nr:CehA/McbA family metallohydrolase [Caldinitratiruptor microaerophilus]BDG59260.1 phosphotransferase [Caldinitratiruptor microaerophilus]